MNLAATLDDYGKPAWIALMILGFILFWPIGLAILGYLIWSGRMGCWKHADRWNERMERKMARLHERMGRAPGRWHRSAPSSGNSAFDEYRAETLRRLEDEQNEFNEFLDRLRRAKDKAEFDQFMSDRRFRPDEPPEEQPQA